MPQFRCGCRIVRSAFLLLLSIPFTHPLALRGQDNVGRIIGVLHDPTGAVIPGASVVARAISTGTQRPAITNAEGAYAFPSLPIGEYLVTVSAQGFKTLEQSAVRIVSSETVTLDFTLELGAATESVKVVGAAPVVDTATATTGTTRTTEELAELPVLILGTNRSVFSLLRTFPGVTPMTSNTDDATYSQGISLTSVNGAPEGGASYNIDGVYGANSGNGTLRDDFSPPPEMIEEMRLNATNSSEYGWNSGVGMTLVTKSGTNQFHGSLFEYFRNEALDSRNFFAARVAANKQNEYGTTLGGPIVKDNTFFFGMWSGYRFRTTPAGVTRTVPTAAMRRGDFSEWLADGRVIYDPATTSTGAQGALIRNPFAGNLIPNARLSPVSVAFQNGYPLPTRPGTQLNWVGSQEATASDTDKALVKIDHNFKGGRHRLSFAWDQKWRTNINGADWPNSPLSTSWYFKNIAWRYRLLYNATIGSNKVFSLRSGFNRFTNNIDPSPDGETGATQAGLKGLTAVTPQTSISLLGTFGNPFAGIYRESEWIIPVYSDLSWNVGTHNVKFGMAYLQNNYIPGSCGGCAGSFSFSNFTTGLPGQSTTGVGYASFLLGEANSGSIFTGNQTTHRTQAYGFYVQDSWRMTAKLTLDYGLRWDFFVNVSERYDRMGRFDPTIPNPGAGGRLGAQAFFGEGAGRNGLHNIGPSAGFWAPRFGIAYALTPKTVFRGGYGLSSSSMFGQLQNGGHIPATGWDWRGSLSSLDGGVTPAFNWTSGFPLSAPPLPNLNPAIVNGSGTSTWDPNDIRSARTQNINAGLGREFPGNLSAKVDYVGTLSHGLLGNNLTQVNQLSQASLRLGNLLLQNINSDAARAAGIALPYPGFNGNVVQALLPFPQFTSITNIGERRGYSLYHSLQMTAQKRFGRDLFFLTSYTLSKQLTNVGSFSGQGVSNNSGRIQNNSEINTKTLGQLDRSQNLSISYLYQLPFGRGKRFANTASAVLGHIVGGWQVAGLHQYVSGDAVAVTTGQSIPGNFGSIWANRVLDVPIASTGCGSYDPNNPARNTYLNVGAFSVPGPFTFGNTRVLPNIRNCGYYNENLSIQKAFSFKERIRTLFSADFTNLFNRHTWTGLQTNVSVPTTFGWYTGATNPRLVQLHLKVEF